MEKFIGKSFLKGHCLCCDNMLQRTSLVPWKNSTVQKTAHFSKVPVFQLDPEWIVEILAHQDHSSPWAAKGFMGCGGHNMAVWHWIAHYSLGYQAGRMRNVRKQYGSNLISNFPKPLIVDFPGDRKSTRLNSSHVRISYAVF